MRVLADRGVEDEQGRVRRLRVELADHPHDLLQLGHEAGLVLQAAGRVDQEHVGAVGSRLLQGVEGEARRVGALRAAR